MIRRLLAMAGASAAIFAGATAHAAQPENWQARFQPAATDIMAQITWFEEYTLWFIVPITVLVMMLLAWCVIRYRASVNPTPSRTSHNTTIEVIWTVGPVVLLLFLAVPSFQLLTAQYTPEEDAKLTIKAIGNQWNWDYEYQVDEEPLAFNSTMMTEAGRAAADKEDLAVYPRLLAVDNDVVVPVNTMVRVLVTASDVIHAFAVPAFGVKVDAVPGRINEIWFKANKEGLYYGQCSELCGKDHAYMPIAVRVVSDEQYMSWLSAARSDLAGANKALMAEVDAARAVTVAGN